jgi:DNA-binding MarR family transcriptional regulator
VLKILPNLLKAERERARRGEAVVDRRQTYSQTLQFACIYATPPRMAETDKREAPRASSLAQDLRAALGKLKRRLRDQADAGDLSPSQTSALLRLEQDGPATASGLARAEGMRPQSMAPILAALESAGLVAGAPDPADGRQTLFALTPHCRKLIKQGRAARQDWLARTIEARLSAREQDALANAVELLKRLVED